VVDKITQIQMIRNIGEEISHTEKGGIGEGGMEVYGSAEMD